MSTQPQSAICIPIQQMGMLLGVLYLESGTPDMFSSSKLQVIDLLCSQVFIARSLFREYAYLLFQRLVFLWKMRSCIPAFTTAKQITALSLTRFQILLSPHIPTETFIMPYLPLSNMQV